MAYILENDVFVFTDCPSGCEQCETTEVCLECSEEFSLRAGRCEARCMHVAQWDKRLQQCLGILKYIINKIQNY